MQQERLLPAPAGAEAPVRLMQVLLQVTEASVRAEAPVLADFSANFVPNINLILGQKCQFGQNVLLPPQVLLHGQVLLCSCYQQENQDLPSPAPAGEPAPVASLLLNFFQLLFGQLIWSIDYVQLSFVYSMDFRDSIASTSPPRGPIIA